jgi:hypothetical protein
MRLRVQLASPLLAISSTPLTFQALREGGVDGVVEGLAPKERRLPPPECLGGDGCGAWGGMRFEEGQIREETIRKEK